MNARITLNDNDKVVLFVTAVDPQSARLPNVLPKQENRRRRCRTRNGRD